MCFLGLFLSQSMAELKIGPTTKNDAGAIPLFSSFLPQPKPTLPPSIYLPTYHRVIVVLVPCLLSKTLEGGS